MITGPLLLTAVKTRLTSKNVLSQITNGLTWGMPTARTTRPYGWIDGLSDSKLRDTNTSRLRRVPWTLHLVLDNPIDEGQPSSVLALNVASAILFAPLTLSSGTVLLNEDPKTTWLEEDYYWHVVMEWLATIQQAANYNPG